MNVVLLWCRLARVRCAPMIAASILAGSSYAVYDAFPFPIVPVALVVAGGIAGLIGGMIASAMLQLYVGTEPVHADRGIEGFQGPEILAAGLVQVSHAAALAALAIAAAVACGAAIVPYAGSTALGLGLAAMVVGLAYALPEFGLRDLGRGLGELAGFATLGSLPALAGYAAVSGRVTFGAFLASLPMGLLGAAVLYTHHEARRRAGEAPSGSPAASGDLRAPWRSRALPWLAYAAVLFDVVVDEYPAWCLLGLLTLPLTVWERPAGDDPDAPTRRLERLHAATSLLVAAGFAISALGG